jgi:hypothetical protein
VDSVSTSQLRAATIFGFLRCRGSSPVERGPEKAGVGSSTLPPGTIPTSVLHPTYHSEEISAPRCYVVRPLGPFRFLDVLGEVGPRSHRPLLKRWRRSWIRLTAPCLRAAILDRIDSALEERRRSAISEVSCSRLVISRLSDPPCGPKLRPETNRSGQFFENHQMRLFGNPVAHAVLRGRHQLDEVLRHY